MSEVGALADEVGGEEGGGKEDGEAAAAECGGKPDVADVREIEAFAPEVESAVGVITGAEELWAARFIVGEGGVEAMEESAILGARHFQSNDIAMGEALVDRAVDGNEMQGARAADDGATEGQGVGAALVEIFCAPADEDGIGAGAGEECAGKWGFVGEQAE